MAELGVPTEAVEGAAIITAPAGALPIAWRGRTKWEPSEDDVSGCEQRIVGLAVAILMVLIWALLPAEVYSCELAVLATIFLALFCTSMLAYVGTTGMLTYETSQGQRILGSVITYPATRKTGGSSRSTRCT